MMAEDEELIWLIRLDSGYKMGEILPISSNSTWYSHGHKTL